MWLVSFTEIPTMVHLKHQKYVGKAVHPILSYMKSEVKLCVNLQLKVLSFKTCAKIKLQINYIFF